MCRLRIPNGIVKAQQFAGLADLAERYGGGERVLGPLRNRLALVLRHGGEDVDGELVGMRVVAGDEIDTSVHERREEGDRCARAGPA